MKILREPLLHFLLIGAALFWLYYEVADTEADFDDLIVVRVADIERLQAGWERRWGRAALPAELDALIDSFVREEVLNREARALGLEDGDSIVRRRLAQKMEFLFADLADQVEITEADLQAYLEENPERFTIPATVAFRHVYFSLDRRGDSTREDAGAALVEIAEGADPMTLGDPFMYQNTFSNQSEAEVARTFGTAFATDLFMMEGTDWAGPVQSGFGLHLVKIDGITEAMVPPLEQVREDVEYELKSERQKEADAAFYSNLRTRYRVQIEGTELAPEQAAL